MKSCRAVELVILRDLTQPLQSNIQALTPTQGSQDSPNKALKISPIRVVPEVDLGQVELQALCSCRSSVADQGLFHKLSADEHR